MLREGEDLIVETGVVSPTDYLYFGNAFGNAQRGFERISETAIDAGLLHKPVDHDLNGVLLVASEFDLVGELMQFAIDDGAGKALRGQVGEQRVVGALTAAHDWGKNLELGAVG